MTERNCFAIAPHLHRRLLRKRPSRRKLCLQHPRSELNVASTRGLGSLEKGSWFKLICGASSQDASSIRNLCEVYTLAGVDCIDVAADESIIRAARKGIDAGVARGLHETDEGPLLMVSINDDSDPHFRKALFEVKYCLKDCKRPCEMVCPAEAIDLTGVIADRCYGCGRCIPVCPIGIVNAIEYVHDTSHVKSMLCQGVDCLEIHTGKGHLSQFTRLWRSIEDADVNKLKIVAVSFPDLGADDDMAQALREMWQVISGSGRFLKSGLTLIWQTDGRPMSGDIGRGTAVHSVRLASKVLRLLDREGLPGHVQLAGGTNFATARQMREAGLLRKTGAQIDKGRLMTASGIAVGGYARKVR